jgi:hypothetical protein
MNFLFLYSMLFPESMSCIRPAAERYHLKKRIYSKSILSIGIIQDEN